MLHIQLFGNFQLFSDHQERFALTKRGQSLLAYLVLGRHRTHTRAELAALLWPETTDPQARSNLRTELTRLRRTLGEFASFLHVEHEVLQWRTQASYTLDVMAFQMALQCAEQALQTSDEVEALMHLRMAIAHYTGDLLPTVYDDWVIAERQRWSEHFVAALGMTIALLRRRHEYTQAIGYARQLLRYDALHEASYRQLMELYAQIGDHANAKRTYQACLTMLRRDLDVPPSPLTQQCYRQIMHPI